MSYKKWTTPWRLHSKDADNMEWIEKPMIDRKWLVVGAIIILGTMYEAHAKADPYEFVASERAEFHLIRNDGMDTHLVWKCEDVSTCYQVFKMKQHKDNSTNCANGMWIERPNGYIWRLK